MTKARTNASASPAVGRNMVINGAMNVSQRATSVTGIGASSGYFTCDRWQINVGATSAGRLTMTQTADGPNGISANCLKLDCTTADASIAAGERLSIGHNIEGQNLQRIGKGVAGAQQITVSFYVKASASFTFGVEVYDQDAGRQITKLFDTTTDWVRHEFTLPADLDDGSSPFDDDNAASLGMFFWLHAGSSFTSGTLNTASFADDGTSTRAAGIDSFFSNTANNFFLTGVQLEVGPVATEFEQEDFGVTLRKCQRYLCTVEKGITGMATTTSDLNFQYAYPVTMRAVPTIAQSVNAVRVGDMVDTGTQLSSTTTTASSHRGLDSGVWAVSGTADNDLTVRRTVLLEPNGSDATFVFDAEL